MSAVLVSQVASPGATPENMDATPENMDATPENMDTAPENVDTALAGASGAASPSGLGSTLPATTSSRSTMAEDVSGGATVGDSTTSIPRIISTPTAVPNTDLANARGEKRTIDQVDNGGNTTDVFVNNFGGSDGLVQVTKRPRKKRSDAGVKRGPRKKPTTRSTAACCIAHLLYFPIRYMVLLCYLVNRSSMQTSRLLE